MQRAQVTFTEDAQSLTPLSQRGNYCLTTSLLQSQPAPTLLSLWDSLRAEASQNSNAGMLGALRDRRLFRVFSSGEEIAAQVNGGTTAHRGCFG